MLLSAACTLSAVVVLAHATERYPQLVPPAIECGGAPPPRWPSPPAPWPTHARPFIFFHDRKTGGTTLRYNLWQSAKARGMRYFIAGKGLVAPTTYDNVVRASVSRAAAGRDREQRFAGTFARAVVVAGHFSYGSSTSASLP